MKSRSHALLGFGLLANVTASYGALHCPFEALVDLPMEFTKPAAIRFSEKGRFEQWNTEPRELPLTAADSRVSVYLERGPDVHFSLDDVHEGQVFTNPSGTRVTVRSIDRVGRKATVEISHGGPGAERVDTKTVSAHPRPNPKYDFVPGFVTEFSVNLPGKVKHTIQVSVPTEMDAAVRKEYLSQIEYLLQQIPESHIKLIKKIRIHPETVPDFRMEPVLRGGIVVGYRHQTVAGRATPDGKIELGVTAVTKLALQNPSDLSTIDIFRHEFGHLLSYAYCGESLPKEWEGAIAKDGKGNILDPQISTVDGSDLMKEDFAESVRLYLKYASASSDMFRQQYPNRAAAIDAILEKTKSQARP